MREELELLNAATRFCADTSGFTEPIAVLRGLDAILRPLRITEALHVLGAWFWPMTHPTDANGWVEGRTVFMLESNNLISDYLATARIHGISSTTLIARQKSVPYTLTEATREIRPTGDERWLIELLRRHGIRDALYCPFTRWTLAYGSPRRIDLAPTPRYTLHMTASAAVGQIEKLKRYPRMLTKNPLSAREVELLTLAAQGLTASVIAAKLQIKTKTVQHYIENASRKLKASNTAQAVAEALHQGFIV
jgi:DNA-binding CsgD family transcriptional regulator